MNEFLTVGELKEFLKPMPDNWSIRVTHVTLTREETKTRTLPLNHAIAKINRDVNLVAIKNLDMLDDAEIRKRIEKI